MTRKALAFTLSLAMAFNLVGCARKPSNAAVDPYENFNRVIFAFNQDVDHLIYRPVSKIYHTILPPPLQMGISNAFDNVNEVTIMANDLLQGKVKYMFLDFWRLVVNSTIGVGGLFDVATRLGLKRHYNDFGMTLSYWSGKTNSPYLEIPLLGPSTFRDALGLGVDYLLSPYPYIRPTSTNYIIQGVRLISIRSQLLDTDQLVDEAFDPYIFVRNAYLQHRRHAIEANMKGEDIGPSASPGRYRLESEFLPLPEANENQEAVHPPMAAHTADTQTKTPLGPKIKK